MSHMYPPALQGRTLPGCATLFGNIPYNQDLVPSEIHVIGSGWRGIGRQCNIQSEMVQEIQISIVAHVGTS